MVKHKTASTRMLLGASAFRVLRRDTGMGWTSPKLFFALGFLAIMTAVVGIGPTSGAPAGASSLDLTHIEVRATLDLPVGTSMFTNAGSLCMTNTTTSPREFNVKTTKEVLLLSADLDTSGTCANGRHLIGWSVDRITPRAHGNVLFDMLPGSAPRLECDASGGLACNVTNALVTDGNSAAVTIEAAVPGKAVEIPVNFGVIPSRGYASVYSTGGTCLTNATTDATWQTSDRESTRYVLSVAPVTQCKADAYRRISWDIRIHGSEDMTAKVDLTLVGSDQRNPRLDCSVGRGQRYRCQVVGGGLDIRYQR